MNNINLADSDFYPIYPESCVILSERMYTRYGSFAILAFEQIDATSVVLSQGKVLTAIDLIFAPQHS
jgi:hypothetical protein